MAQRLATIYVNACLELTEAELEGFIRLFADEGANLQVKILDNGNQELEFPDEAGGESVLTFERKADKYISLSSFRLMNPQLAGIMQKAVSRFKGNAIVNRVYHGFTMLYEYEYGSVVKIAELKDGREKVVYEYKTTTSQLERMFFRVDAERRIAEALAEINSLLDLRNKIGEKAVTVIIDERLHMLTHTLFVLEA